MFCWSADLYELWVQPCRSWSRPGSSQCRCTRRSVRGGRWGQPGNILGHRTQTWSDCSQREAHHPATEQATIHSVAVANFSVIFSLEIIISFFSLHLCKMTSAITLSSNNFIDILAPLSNIIPYTTEYLDLVSLQPQQPDGMSPQCARPRPPWWFQT